MDTSQQTKNGVPHQKGNSISFENSYQHLVQELQRVQALLELRVRAQLKFQPQADQLGFSGNLSHTEIERLLVLCRQPEAVQSASQRVPEELEEIFEKVRQTAVETAERRQASASGANLKLDDLCRTCQLTPLEQDIVLVCLLSVLNPNVRPLFAYLNQKGSYDWATPESVSGILAPSFAQVQQMRQCFAPQGTLMRLGILSLIGTDPDPFKQRLIISPEVVSLLLDQPVLQAPLNLFVTSIQPRKSLDGLMMPEKSTQTIRHVLGRYRRGSDQAKLAGQPGISLQVGLDGYSSADHLMVAEGIATELSGSPLLHLSLEPLLQQSEFEAIIKRILLWVRLTGTPLFISGCQALAKADVDRTTIWQTLMREATGLIILDLVPQLENSGLRPSIITLTLGKRGYEARLKLWQSEIESVPTAADVDPDQLANVYQLDASQIAAAVDWAKGAALINSGDGIPVVCQADLQKGARLQSDTALAQQAEHIQATHDWEDLILPDETIYQLREIYLRIKHRARVFDLWGLGKKVIAKQGLSVLFAGPSGTGKTMAAGIIANGLGQDLYRVDLSTLVSKYIGETEKNLNKIFDAAEQSNAVLFFDEADAIFGKRSDVKDSHDRYANLQVAYLLQRMESFSGIAILATNLIANTDDAFIRRLDFIVTFPEPEPDQRARIWQHHLESSGKLPLGTIDYTFLAERFQMTGGLIRNAVVQAAFLAAEDGGVVEMHHLLQAVKREYQKQRRLVDESSFAEFTPASQ